MRNFLSLILNSLLFYSKLSLNIKVLYKIFFDCAIFKGTVSRDFLLLVFFMNQFPPVATGVNDTGGKFATGVNDTGGK